MTQKKARMTAIDRLFSRDPTGAWKGYRRSHPPHHRVFTLYDSGIVEVTLSPPDAETAVKGWLYMEEDAVEERDRLTKLFCHPATKNIREVGDELISLREALLEVVDEPTPYVKAVVELLLEPPGGKEAPADAEGWAANAIYALLSKQNSQIVKGWIYAKAPKVLTDEEACAQFQVTARRAD